VEESELPLKLPDMDDFAPGNDPQGRWSLVNTGTERRMDALYMDRWVVNTGTDMGRMDAMHRIWGVTDAAN